MTRGPADDDASGAFDDDDPPYSSVRECAGCGALTMPGPDHRCPNCGEPIG